LINDSHILALKLATEEEIEKIKGMALKVNQVLSDFFLTKNLKLVDFKLEFGKHKGEIILADEISPDTCRLWDTETGEKMDKDRFRRDLGGIEEAYQEVMKRLEQ
jgi:phosphoribosylaminoimidazole-succinocarboxamide synthase